MKMTENILTVEQTGGVLTIILNRPTKRNALNLALRHELTSVLRTIPTGVGAVVLTGADPAFCAGVDIGELREIGREAARSDPPTDAITSCAVPVLAAVNGACWTGGLEVALACDFIFASDRASFGDSHAQLGLMPGWGGSARLALAVGERRAAQLMLTGTPISAELALAWGLVNEVLPHEQLLERAREVAARIADAPSGSRSVALTLLRSGAGHTLSQRLTLADEQRKNLDTDAASAADRFTQRSGGAQ